MECPDDGTALTTRKMLDPLGRLRWMSWCWRCGATYPNPGANTWQDELAERAERERQLRQ